VFAPLGLFRFRFRFRLRFRRKRGKRAPKNRVTHVDAALLSWVEVEPIRDVVGRTQLGDKSQVNCKEAILQVAHIHTSCRHPHQRNRRWNKEIRLQIPPTIIWIEATQTHKRAI